MRKYINCKRLIKGIKEKGLKLLIDKDIILNDTPPINYSKIFTYRGRKRKLVNYGRLKKVLKPIRFKIVGLINFFIYF